jgi:hypothetical protein
MREMDAMMLRSAEADPHVTELTQHRQPKPTASSSPNRFPSNTAEAMPAFQQSSHPSDRHGLSGRFSKTTTEAAVL